MITLRQLRYFHALAASGHFGRAAAASGISQPALSMQLRELETTLGGPLVERGPDGASLTGLGRDVEGRVTHILSAVRDLEEVARAQSGRLAGPLRLGVIPSVAPFLLPRLLARAARAYPALQLVVRETITAHLIEELADGSLDAIVASLPLDAGDFEEAPAFDDTFLLAAPAGSPHARRSPALAEAIAADELLLLEDGHCLRDQALAVCHRIDPRRLRSFGATSIATVVQLVAAGQGITLLPQMAVDAGMSADPRLAVVRFAPPEPHRTIGLAWRRVSPRRAHFLALVDLLRPAELGQDGGGAAWTHKETGAMTASWQFWAIASAAFAALTAIFAKVGVENVNSDYATFIRTIVILIVIAGILLGLGEMRSPASISPRTYLFLTLSGLATGGSWLCYFRALKIGNAAQVAPVDKMSVVLVAIFGVLFLGEKLSLMNWLGVALVGGGAILIAF